MYRATSFSAAIFCASNAFIWASACFTSRFKRGGVEVEQRLPLLHDVAVLEVDLRDVPPHARTHLDGLERLQPAVVVVFVHQVADDRMGHGDAGRFFLFVSARFWAATGEGESCQQGQG